MHTIGVFANIWTPDQELLLVRQNYAGFEWACAGGRLEKGEDLLSGLHREVWEEARCKVRVTEMVGTYIAPYADDLVIFFDTILEESHSWQPDDEICDIGYFHPDALPDPISVATKLRIRDAVAGKRGVVATFAKDTQGRVTMVHHLTSP